jgi:hypothetical protein
VTDAPVDLVSEFHETSLPTGRYLMAGPNEVDAYFVDDS